MLGGLISAGVGLLGGLFGGGSKQKQTQTQSSTVTNSIDFKGLVRDAEAAGFNPLTVVRGGGLAGYMTTNTTGSSTMVQQGPSLMSRIAGGLTGALQGWNSYDPFRGERAQLELGIARAQLENLNSDTALNNRRLAIPTWTGTGNVFSSGGFGGAVRSALPDPELGAIATPSPGEVQVTHPWPVGRINPALRNAEHYEERYGELGGSVLGVINMVGDAWANRDVARDYYMDHARNAGNFLMGQYEALVKSWSRNGD